MVPALLVACEFRHAKREKASSVGSEECFCARWYRGLEPGIVWNPALQGNGGKRDCFPSAKTDHDPFKRRNRQPSTWPKRLPLFVEFYLSLKSYTITVFRVSLTAAKFTAGPFGSSSAIPNAAPTVESTANSVTNLPDLVNSTISLC